MHTQVTKSGLLQILTIMMLIYIAGLSFLLFHNVFGALFFLPPVVYVILWIRELKLPAKEKNRSIANRLFLAWMYIFFELSLLYRHQIWEFLVWIPPVLFCFWVVLSGEWKEVYVSLQHFFRFLTISLEYYKLKVIEIKKKKRVS